MKKVILINLIFIGGFTSNKTTAQTNNDFKVHLTMTYEHYINLKAIKTKKEWEEQAVKMNNSIKSIIASKDIEVQRKNFAVLSLTLHNVIKEYGVIGMKTYYQYCPMALDGEGAYWLSLHEKIENPYFGDKMLTCGEIKEIIK